MIKSHICCLVWVLLAVTVSSSDKCSLKEDEFFVTFHPHLDAFWLNYDTELKDINFRPAGFLYNMNQRNSKTIFNSMLDALEGDVARKYFVTEAVFFKDWYDYLSNDKKQKVKNLLKNKQLQIGNAAWVENDEAVCYYDDVIDQYTLGMNFLYEEFKYQNKIGWATDSFGHSHSQAAVEHLLGIEFQGIQRVDDRYVNQHKDQALLEFYWIPVSDSNNQTYGGVINQIRHFLHEVNNLRGARVTQIVDDFDQLTNRMKDVYHKNKFFRFLGNDFEEFVQEEFRNLEEAMNKLNDKHGSNSCPMYKYGNPEDYLEVIENYYQKNKLPTRKFDFMPNWDQDRFWTGYYTTDPALKKACKDFSRLVNFYRKALLTTRDKIPDKHDKPLQNAEELLAVLQHHDGITATSKTYIEDEFKNRMDKQSKQIEKALNKIYYNSDQNFSQENSNILLCEFFKNANKCQISGQKTYKLLNIITYGNAKKERIQLQLPSEHFYTIENHEVDIFCEDGINCKLVFEAILFPGINQFKLIAKDKSQVTAQITELEVASEKQHSGRDYSIDLDKSTKKIKYEFNGGSEYLQFGFFTSQNRGSSRRTMSWDKYGRKTDKTEHVVPGMYIMSNTGTVEPLNHQFTQLRVAQGKNFRKFVFKSNVISKLEITVQNQKPNLIDIVFEFKPVGRNMVDYFLKVDSPVKSDALYHDSQGFLVAKRILNERPDYEYEFKKEDLINGNTYPACSFAYLLNGGKKVVFSTDRAQGVAAFEKGLLINFDRLAMDDGKGVGEGYSRSIQNTFHYKFAVVQQKNTIQRKWQREYDEGLIGYVSSDDSKSIRDLGRQIHRNNYLPANNLESLKYTIFILNDNEIVLRLQNLGEFESIEVPKYKKDSNTWRWIIKELGLDISAGSITESYANGIPLEKDQQWRKNFSKQPNEISIFMRPPENEKTITLRPLELRSFRINLKGAVQKVESASDIQPSKPEETQKQKTEEKQEEFTMIQGYKGSRKRCFL